MANERIKWKKMSIQDVITAMSGGNYGASRVCIELLLKGEKVDPDAFRFSGRLSSLWMLDTLGIYEERIYMLWSNVCKRDIGKMIAVLRAHQIGHLAGVDTKTLDRAIYNRGAGIDLDAVVEAVKSHLPNFNPEAAA